MQSPEGVQLAVKVVHHLDGAEDLYIDLILIRLDNITSHIPGIHIGREGHGRLNISYRVQCTDDFYGPNCATFCVERDDEMGHYTCDSEGNIVCREGYQDPSTNCIECIPDEGCCKS